MARRKRNPGRNLNGILLLDKPMGLTSNAALQRVKGIYKAAKAGHTGSLDPMATGLLPLCFGEATKLSAYLLDADKRYTGTIKLGQQTNTGDAEGEVIATRPVEGVTEARVLEVLDQFLGEQQQTPPMHSAIKHQGQPLYKLARQGIEIERKSRTITIYALQLLGVAGDEIEIDVHCSKGTYIRTLAEEIGEALGCGGHLCQLRRTASGPFSEEGMITLEQVTALAEADFTELDALLLPMESALADWPEIRLSDNSLYYVRQGQPVQIAKAPSHGLVSLFSEKDEFVGIGCILDDGRVAPKRLLGTG